ncbi:hypothetical protein PUN28_001342 [Cardiocondyla obscurior]|uniref:Uncharacterized protein n=1 Tax=Cardiocondyla obscurior TaxID=286306 RepID=A0AAW2H4I4_9HYME
MFVKPAIFCAYVYIFKKEKKNLSSENGKRFMNLLPSIRQADNNNSSEN